MKRLVLASAVAATAFALPAVSLHAAAPASDSAANYTGNYNNGNLGTGFGSAYIVNTNNASTNNAGTFLGTSGANGNGGAGNIDTGGQSFALYANGGATTLVNRSFSVGGPSGNAFLAAGQTFTLRMDNGFVDTGASVGFNLLSSTGASRFTFQFVGGNNAYTYNTANADTSTGVGFTSDGLTISYTQNAGTAFTLAITPFGGTTTTINGNVPVADVAQFQVFDANAGSGTSNNLYFNSPTVVPEPSTMILLAAGATGLLIFRRRHLA